MLQKILTAGNLIKKIDALGVITNFTYDALNRMLTLDLPGTGQDIAYTYDSGTNGVGRLTGIADPSGTLAFQYDKRGNLTQEQKTMDSHTFTTQYQYDKNGNLKKLIYPNGRDVTYTLNQANQITQVDSLMGGNSKTLAQTIAYAPFGPIKTYSAGNGLPIINQYDTDYQLTTLKAGAVINRDYQYDETGNVTQITNMGNLPATTAEALTYNYQNNNNQLTQAINGSATTFAYNAAGNLITEQKNTVTRTYTYNDHQRLASVTEGGATLGQYTYDAMGKRTKKVAGEVTTLYIYDQNGLLIAEYDGSGVWQKDYLYLNGQPLTMIVANTPENVYYYHNDHLGTPQMMTDSTGTIVWAATYEPFGEATIAPTSTVTNNLRFPGQYFDAETGLCYNWNRDYNQHLGRYIESDPIGVQKGKNHLYAYGANNPVIGIDFRGLKTYMCEQPLHAFGGEGTRSGPDIWWNPLYHEYLCVGNPYVATTCYGQDRSGGPYSLGQPSNDVFDWYKCSEVEADNKCLEDCIKLEGRKPRPYYGLLGPFTNCQEWVEGTLKKCKENCKCEE